MPIGIPMMWRTSVWPATGTRTVSPPERNRGPAPGGDGPLGLRSGQLRVSGLLARVDDREVLAHEDLELVAGARLDVRLVRRGRVAVRLGADDRRAGVLGVDGRLDLVLRVAGQRGLAGAGAGAAVAAPAARPAAAAA